MRLATMQEKLGLQVQRIVKPTRYLTLRSFDDGTPQGRSMERYRRALLTTVFAILSKVVSILTVIVSVPLTLHYLGSERYAIWLTLASFMAMLSFSDLGIGNGLINTISECHGREDEAGARHAVSSAFYMLALIGAAILAVEACLYSFIPWPRFFNVHSALASYECGRAVMVFLVCFALNLPLGIVSRVHIGYQEGYLANFWTSMASIFSLVGILIAIHFRVSLPVLVGVLAGSLPAVYFLNGIVLFGWLRPWLRPSLRYMQKSYIGKIMGMGAVFMLLQFCVAVGYSSDSIVIAQILGVSAVTEYAIPARLFQFIPMFISFGLNSLWPAYSEALARGDSTWVEVTLRKSMKLSFLMNAGAALALVFLSRIFLHVWVGNMVHPPIMFLVSLGLAATVNGVVGPVSAFLNGTHTMRPQLPAFLLMMALNLWLSIWLTRLIGISGVIWGTAISQVVLLALLFYFVVPAVLVRIRAVVRVQAEQLAQEEIIVVYVESAGL